MRRRTALALALIAIVPAVALVRALRLDSAEIEPEAGPPVEVDAARLAESLSQAIRFRTVSLDPEGPAPAPDAAAASAREWERLLAWLEDRYPLLHARARSEPIGERGRLLTWQGADASAEPVLFAAHLDVVPADAPESWEHPPFDGTVADGFVHGRGALDDKGPAIALLSAAEQLLAGGFAPRRTIYLALGGDEEIGGGQGAARIAAALAERRVRLSWVLDEGLAQTKGVIKAVDRPVALIGLAEKGYLSLELTAESDGGHSSMPPPSTAIGRLATAIARLEAEPFPARIDGVAAQMLAALAPHAPFSQRVALANPWLFEPFVRRSLLGGEATAALLRTTTAVTLVQGGVKENVLPTRATAVVNLRLHPRDTAAAAEARVRERVGAEIGVRRLEGSLGREATAVSDPHGEGFLAVARAVRATWPEALVAPGLVLGATDARHYAPIARDVLRFAPLVLEPADLERIHGIDERVAVDELAAAVGFYVRLLRGL